MEVIMKERNRREKASGGKVILFIIATILFINISMVFIGRLKPLAAGLSSLVLILLIMFIAYKIMVDVVTEYCYILTDRGILFHRAMGIREIRLMEAPYDKIIDIKSEVDLKSKGKVYHFLCNKEDSRKKTLSFKDGHRIYTVVFAPSQNFLNALVERTEDQK